ncbi:histidine decarboxylase [Isoalcanivorax beigongshangi]|uniref:Histidine decarboxylase n=1 Tax=Isoalcanivorax beigongshangi TaxID=3238810 RepID=A0ABV4AET8_9GAMM
MTLSAADQSRLDAFWHYCLEHQHFNLGYPEAADFDYAALEPFLRFSLNNCGDWGEASNYLLNSFGFEKEVVQYFADLFRISADQCWGYVTHGGTEGNLFGCYLARELFADGILYCSRDTHYSVAKIVRLLRLPCRWVASQPGGEMDYDDLSRQLQIDRCRHPIIFANLGTTLRGAVDDLAEIQRRLARHGLHREQYYLHGDAALSGMILPFVDQPQPHTFADGLDSISVSGHKMIGSPMPCGIVLAQQRHVQQVSVAVDYISARDQTISGSRNGHTPLLLWAALRSRTASGWRQRIAQCVARADQAIERFQSAGVPAWRHHNSITVVFPCPSEPTWRRHCLATSGDTAHLITLPHQQPAQLERAIDDICAEWQTLTVPHTEVRAARRASSSS